MCEGVSVRSHGLMKICNYFQRIYGPEAERNFYESQMIILDTLEQVLNSVSMIYDMI